MAGRKTNKQKHYEKVGRKLFDGKDINIVLTKLEDAARIDASVGEMCFYADISVQAYYRYIEKNPKFGERIKLLRERLLLKSRQNIAVNIDNGDVSLSKWLLERKKSEEFGEKVKLEHSGEINGNNDSVHPEDEELRVEFKQKLLENIRKRAKENAQKKDENTKDSK